MMECEVIRDLIPLYLDECCSPRSRQLVEEHLKKCDACRAYIKNMEMDFQMKDEETEEYMKEEQLLKGSRENLKKEVKTDYMGKLIKIDIPLNLAACAFLMSRCIADVKAGCFRAPLVYSYGHGFEGLQWVLMFLCVVWIIFDIWFLKECKKSKINMIPWAMAGLSFFAKLIAILLFGITGIVILFAR